MRQNASEILDCKVPRRVRRAFTIIELLVVIGLIAIMLTLVIAAFGYVTGSRSIEATHNMVSAMLSQARTRAINNNQYTGVCFFQDPNSGRSMAVIVVRDNTQETDTDPYDNYKSYDSSFKYVQGQRVVFPTQYSNSVPANKWLMAIFVRTANGSGSVTGASPPVTIGPGTGSPPPLFADTSGYWQLYIPGNTDMPPDVDVQTLPSGIGVSALNDPVRNPNLPFRYVPLGVIFFDPQGHIACLSFTIAAGTSLGNAIGLTGSYPLAPGLPSLPTVSGSAYSDFGVALYDAPSLANQGYSPPYGTSTADTWIDSNGQIWIVNRANGQLVTTP